MPASLYSRFKSVLSLTLFAFCVFFVAYGRATQSQGPISSDVSKLTVYVSGDSYSVPIRVLSKADYVSLGDVLQPLGKVQMRVKAGNYSVSLNDIAGQFDDGKKLAQVGQTRVLLSAKAIGDSGRVLVPVHSLAGIVEKYIGKHCELHEADRRLFVGDVAPAVTAPVVTAAVATQQPPGGKNPPQKVPPTTAVRFFVMIDASHGGEDPGARFTDKLFEKEITLVIARKLRTELQSRGIPASLLRDSDATLSYDQRALATNSQHAALYVAIHAGVPGRGVRAYTAVMPAGQETDKKNGPFVPWETAQASHLARSQEIAGAIAKELTRARINSSVATAPLLPLHAIATPAIALEVTPPSADFRPEAMSAMKYQQAIVVAVAQAIADSRAKLEERR